MYVGKTLFAQVMEFVPWTSFARIVQRYRGNACVRTLSCPEHADFHLLAQRVNGAAIASPGIDAFAAAAGARRLDSVNAGDLDVDSRPGAQDIDGVGLAAASGNNVYDLGAYEMQPIIDRIFADGFGDPVRLAY